MNESYYNFICYPGNITTAKSNENVYTSLSLVVIIVV